MFLRGLRLLCGRYNPRPAEERFRAGKQHCGELGCHGRGAGLCFREARGRWRGGRRGEANSHDRAYC